MKKNKSPPLRNSRHTGVEAAGMANEQTFKDRLCDLFI